MIETDPVFGEDRNHKDGTVGVWGCDNYASRAECPICQVFDATTCIEEAIARVKTVERITGNQRAFTIHADLAMLSNRLSALDWRKP